MKDSLNTLLLVLVLIGTGVNTYLLVSDSGDDDRPGSMMENSMTGHTPDDGHDHGATVVNPLETPPANTPPAGPATSVAFEKTSHDFGTIKQDTKNTYVFKFTNTGTEPLIIQNAQGSCGCTVPQYPKEPIPPGASGDITVEYSPGKQQGMQNKTVTITANTNPPQTLLNISANVEAVPGAQ